MSGIVWSLIATAIFVLINGFFVASEFALVKVRPSRVAALARRGDKSALIMARMLARLDLYLSACQLGITLASLILGWLAEPAVAALIIAGLSAAGLSVDAHIVHVAALALALTLVTVLHMTVGEQAPKILSIRRAESVAKHVARPLWIFTLVFRPLIALVNKISNLLLKMFGLQPDGHAEPPLDAEEIKDLLARSTSVGLLSRRQGEFARNVLGIARLEVRHILVHRVDVVALLAESSVEENLARIRQSGHTRFPLCHSDLDSVIGIVHAKAVLGVLAEGGRPNFEELARKPIFVPESLKISRMIHELQQVGSGCAVVVDEYGAALGMAFLDDALEQIVGPIRDEFDSSESEYKEVSQGVFELDGRMDLPTACELLGIEEYGDEDTIGGYVVDQLGRLPRNGDKIDIGPYEVEVTDAQNHHARLLRAVKRDDGKTE